VLLLVFGVIGLAASTAVVSREKARTEDALGRERQRAEEAEQRFQLARRSADEMIRIANEELSTDPGQQPLRRRLLESALTYYQEFIDLRRDAPDAQAELEATRTKVKDILSDLAVMQGAWKHALLGNPAVQDALKLTPDQRAKVADMVREIGGRHFDLPRGLSRLTAEEQTQRLVDEMKAHEPVVVNLLGPDQLTRLGQIALQARGPMAFRDPDVVAKLGLTAEQREQLRALDFGGPGGFGGRGEFGPGFDGGGPKRGVEPKPKDFPDGRRKEALDRILAVLTPDQQARWKALTGDPVPGVPGPGFPRGPGGGQGRPFGPRE
jgi:hypothetical protein